MPDCTVQDELFPGFARHRIEVAFDGGGIASDAGLLLLRQTNLRLRLLERVARHLPDPRYPLLIRHSTLELLRQRVYAIVCHLPDDHKACDGIVQSVNRTHLSWLGVGFYLPRAV